MAQVTQNGSAVCLDNSSCSSISTASIVAAVIDNAHYAAYTIEPAAAVSFTAANLNVSTSYLISILFLIFKKSVHSHPFLPKLQHYLTGITKLHVNQKTEYV
jgi:polyisoprenoid-binding protein YceI